MKQMGPVIVMRACESIKETKQGMTIKVPTEHVKQRTPCNLCLFLSGYGYDIYSGLFVGVEKMNVN